MEKKVTVYSFEPGKMGRVEIQPKTTIYADRVRAKCITQGWYTRGDVKAYTAMLEYVRKIEDVETEQILAIADDIYVHSNPDIWEGYDGNPVLNIMFELRNDCCVTFYEEVK